MIFTQEVPLTRKWFLLEVLQSILRREETGVPRGNPRSQVEIDWKLNPQTTFVVEVEGVTDVQYASLTSQGVQHSVFHLDGHPSRYQPRQQDLTSVNRREPVFFPLMIA